MNRSQPVPGCLAPRGLVWRLALVLTTLLVVVSQLTAAGHMTLVRHTLCLEHGDLTHASEIQHVVLPEVAPSGLSAAEQAPPPDTVGHDHCQGASRLKEQLALPTAQPRITIDATEADTRLALASRSYFAPTSRLDVAPKQSPPAV
ncbi:MAG: hypothetical protein KC776_18115 [Myxococcales bacterium]|nr:hypothetical protein [Myxococcales bacterium]MCB9580858.1 hypothetical protein [Polyangiaceae bacterium]